MNKRIKPGILTTEITKKCSVYNPPLSAIIKTLVIPEVFYRKSMAENGFTIKNFGNDKFCSNINAGEREKKRGFRFSVYSSLFICFLFLLVLSFSFFSKDWFTLHPVFALGLGLLLLVFMLNFTALYFIRKSLEPIKYNGGPKTI